MENICSIPCPVMGISLFGIRMPICIWLIYRLCKVIHWRRRIATMWKAIIHGVGLQTFPVTSEGYGFLFSFYEILQYTWIHHRRGKETRACVGRESERRQRSRCKVQVKKSVAWSDRATLLCFYTYFVAILSMNRSIIRLAATKELISLFKTCFSVCSSMPSTAGLW